MIRKIEIENFKSVKKLELELGRVTVLIGANGAGKSNILEGIAFGAAAADGKLDYEFFASRGIRVPDDNRWILPAFPTNEKINSVTYRIELDSTKLELYFARFRVLCSSQKWDRFWDTTVPSPGGEYEDSLIELRKFLIYSPENKELRTFSEETQISSPRHSWRGPFPPPENPQPAG